MNRIYKSIWNKATGGFVAVSELVNNSGGGQASVASGAAASFRGFCVKALSAALLFAVGNITLGSVAYAAPIGGTVTNGAAHISSGGNTTTINQTSQNTTLNWQSFGINKGETVNFVQPNSNAVALNRVLGNSASNIYGTLNANGKVFLINPNGILFGSGASVNVDGLVASTLNLSDADFMAGNYHFTGASLASVQNAGAISAANGGYVALLGANVSNQGTITARMGTVALAGGQDITLDVAGDGLLNVAVNQGTVNALVQNGGLIKADGGQVVMTAQAAGQLLNTVVNNTGIVEVQSLNGSSGSIKLLGDMQTGTVNVGGTLDASAPNGGNGGSIETSAAHVEIANNAVATTRAANGLNGSWLIDPTDFTIAASGGDETGTQLSTALGSNNVTILTGTGGTGASGTNGDIFVNDVVSWSANNTLTLSAYRNININSSITSSGTAGGVALLYGQQGAVNAGNTATYNVNAPVNLAQGNSFSTKLGSNGTTVNYTVVDSLGAAANATTAPTTMTLQGMAASTSLAGNYVLGSNIDASATSGWNSNAGFTPIGNYSYRFTGTFDGLGHTIANLIINSPSTSYVGLFGFIDLTAAIRNVGLVGGSIAGQDEVGGLVGANNTSGTLTNDYATGNVTGGASSLNVGGLVGENIIGGGALTNDYATGSVTAGTGSGYVGGLVGDNNGGGTLTNDYATGSVTAGASSSAVGGLAGNNIGGTLTNDYATGSVTAGTGSTRVGGLVGYDSGPLTNDYATGSVTGSGYVGGLVGHNQGGTLTNDYATGAVTGTGSDVGGLVGYNMGSPISNSYATGAVSGSNYVGGLVGDNMGTISNSYATGAVSGSTYVGGLAGNNTGTISNIYATGAVSGLKYVGGLVGYNYSGGTISNSYATGAVSGSKYVGGLVGDNYGSTISNSYWNNTVNSSFPAGTTGLTTTQMQTASNFAGFIFTTTPGATGNNWVMVDGNGTLNNSGGALGATFPMLASEYSTTINNAHQLQLMAMNPSASYTLGSNIDASNTVTASTLKDVWSTTGGFAPIGNGSTNFTGTFDGLGHTISNLTINRSSTSNVGLFGYVGGAGVIKNVGLVGGSVTGGGVGNVGGLVGANDGTLTNDYATGAVSGFVSVGGLVGYNGGTISNSYATGSVTSVTSGTLDNVGGLVGSNAGTLTNDYATGAVSGLSAVGGLVGDNVGTLTNDYATGSVTSGTNSLYAGGLVGYNQPNGTLTNDYATGAVSGSSEVGGLVGWNGGTLTNGYATGAVSGSNYVGGLVGWNSTLGTLTNAYFDTATTGQSVGVGGGIGSAMGLTTAQMQAQSSFIGFDFTTPVWGFGTVSSNSANTNNNMPVLCVFGGCGLITTTVYVDPITGSSIYGSSPVITYDFVNNSGSVITLTNATANGTAAYTGAPTASSNVSPYNFSYLSGLSLTGSGKSNYTLAPYAQSTTWTVTPANLTLSGTRVYDGSTLMPGSDLMATGVNGQTFSVTGSGSSGNLTSKNVQTNQALASLSGLAIGASGNGGMASNYNNLSTTGSSVSVTPLAITVAATGVNKVYDATATDAATLASAGVITGDSVTFADTSATFADKNVGNGKTVSVAGIADSGTDAGNYTLNNTTASTTANITPKALTETGLTVAASTVYDGGTSAAVSGTAALAAAEAVGAGTTADGKAYTGDTVAITGTASGTYNSKDVATAANVTFSGLGVNNTNYTLTQQSSASATITPATLTATVAAPSKVYDGTTTAAPTLAITSGLVGTETVTATGTATFNSKDVANANLVTVNSDALANGSNGGLASNYSLATGETVASTITPAPLTVTANNASKIYDAVLPTLGVSYSGFVNGETVASLSAAPTVTTPATTSSSSGSYPIIASGAVDSNYRFTYVNGILTVTPASSLWGRFRILLPLSAAYSPITTVFDDGTLTSGNSTMPESPTLTGVDIGTNLFTGQPGPFDGLNLQIINHGIKLPKGLIISQVSDHTL